MRLAAAPLDSTREGLQAIDVIIKVMENKNRALHYERVNLWSYSMNQPNVKSEVV